MIDEHFQAVSRRITVAILSRLLGTPKTPVASRAPVSGRILYVAASCLPYHVSGYTTRTHEVVRTLGDSGADVRVLTRPGYPWDRGDRCRDAEGEWTNVDDVAYRHLRHPPNKLPVVMYAPLAAKSVLKVALAERVSVIHAASNHVNALPALLAARKLGIPFHYEMRGLWELTRISRMPEYEGSQAYKQGLQLEGLVARHADRLFVISEQLGKYARDHWCIAADRMTLLPNCIDPDRFMPVDPQQVEPDSIGYAGSLIGYEGLDTLIEAVARLKEQEVKVKVRIVGDGEARGDLEALAARLGLVDRVQFMGRQSPEVAREVIRRSTLVCLPRKPYEVCCIVPPIKLVEAMAMGKPVIVPDLPVFRDELGAEPVGWSFQSGNAADLAQVIEAAFADEAALAAMAIKAREYAVSKRSWGRYVTPIVGSLAG